MPTLQEQLESQRKINQRLIREKNGIQEQPKQSAAKKKGRKNASTETTEQQADAGFGEGVSSTDE